MLKSIQLKLSKVKYGRDSLGDDICIEIEALGKLLRVDKRINAGTATEINREVGRFETDRGSFQAEVFINVVEKDLLFNDAGSTKGSIKVDAAITEPQQFIFKVHVRETRSILGKFWGTKTAIFEITLEAEVSDAIRYVQDEGDGWLKVVMEDRGVTESMPAYLKVKVERVDAKREYFTILEGPHRGKFASVALHADGSSRFISNIEHEPLARAMYSISQKTFIIQGKKYKTVDYPESPWKKGLYDIEIPDYPHQGGARYPEAQRAKIWFRIGHSGERYLHAGGRSLGCMTVIETKRWMEIYNSLIKARKGDFMSVGALEVVD
ncbi:MAG: hypothetical protein A3H70_00185 [Candidatus Komeilibacteria bacterium RIFCSPLOWO2_02_FULL_48_11]|uniref:Uncharacterized protein n=1 Tax=Candidatus Komeilibacteria bacterium RIFCSPLOWO2_02_FULL_48_11 TaxID=1798553 RepID=A0A1G2BS90_9BACT|nr:MAG: hypothetical protein A3H70_00185 [Candidatus Komeilibacteria bacterium RIFCSPLOWO2_02_FULL_48_11]